MKASKVVLKVRGRTFTMFIDDYRSTLPVNASGAILSPMTSEALRRAVRLFLRNIVLPSLGIKAPKTKDLFNT